MKEVISKRWEKIVRKGENASYQHFLLFSQCYQKLLPFSRDPLPNNKFLDSSKLKELADDKFIFDENDRKFSKRVENTVGKREIAHDHQFLLSRSVFKRLVLHTCKNQGLFGKGSSEI